MKTFIYETKGLLIVPGKEISTLQLFLRIIGILKVANKK